MLENSTRIDIHIEVPCVDYEKLSGDQVGKTSESIRKRVQIARDIQFQSFSKLDSKYKIFYNVDMWVRELRRFCKLMGKVRV